MASEEGKRIGLFGASGTGKTTKARILIGKICRLVVFDPKREWEREGKNWLSLFRPVYSLDELKKALKKSFSKRFQIVYIPRFGDEKKELDALCKYIYLLQSSYKTQHMAKITLFVDEAQMGIPAGTSRNNPAHGALLLAQMGRDKGVNLIVASQRLKTVDINIRANLSSCYIFRLAELADINEANQIIHNKEGLLRMADYQYFYRDEKGRVKFFDNR